MRILALDTTTDISSIGVADESGTIAQYDFAHKMDLSRRLMPNIVSMLKDCGMKVKDVEAIGVSIGPGSFTGLRIGVTTAKTLAQTLGIPIAGIVTLDLLAHQFDYLPDAVVCPITRVRKGEVYFAFYRATAGAIERLSDYKAEPIEDMVAASRRQSAASGQQPAVRSRGRRREAPSPMSESDIGEGWGEGGVSNAVSGVELPGPLDPSTPGTLIVCGDALEENLPALKSALGDRFIPTPQSFSYPKAHDIARLALKKITAGKADDPLSLMPFYIRRSAPEERGA